MRILPSGVRIMHGSSGQECDYKHALRRLPSNENSCHECEYCQAAPHTMYHIIWKCEHFRPQREAEGSLLALAEAIGPTRAATPRHGGFVGSCHLRLDALRCSTRTQPSGFGYSSSSHSSNFCMSSTSGSTYLHCLIIRGIHTDHFSDSPRPFLSGAAVR